MEIKEIVNTDGVIGVMQEWLNRYMSDIFRFDNYVFGKYDSPRGAVALIGVTDALEAQVDHLSACLAERDTAIAVAERLIYLLDAYTPEQYTTCEPTLLYAHDQYHLVRVFKAGVVIVDGRFDSLAGLVGYLEFFVFLEATRQMARELSQSASNEFLEAWGKHLVGNDRLMADGRFLLAKADNISVEVAQGGSVELVEYMCGNREVIKVFLNTLEIYEWLVQSST